MKSIMSGLDRIDAKSWRVFVTSLLRFQGSQQYQCLAGS
jgi:hypothetical protein